MEALGRIVLRRRYTPYAEIPDRIEPVFALFSSAPESSYRMSDIAKRTQVPIRTLYHWRERIQHDATWRPTPDRFRKNPRAFPDELEELMATYVKDNFVSPGRDLSMAVLKQTLLMLVQSYVASAQLPESALEFKCSTTYVRRFLRRNGLSYRRARPARRPEIDENEVEEFTVSFYASYEVFGPPAIVNFDESSWRLVMTSDRTVAQRGAESVRRYVNGDIKATFTFLASIVADGTKLPLTLIAKGKTTRSHRQLGRHDTFPHQIWHSPSGWCNGELMLQFLQWLRTQIEAPEICLVLDQFHAHDTPEVHEMAQAHNIHLLFVPRGGTGRYQPLDRRVFGALKAKGRAKWATNYQANPGTSCTRPIAAALLLACWAELSESCVLAGWDLEADPMESDSSSSDSDGEWSLTLCDEPSGSGDDGEEDVDGDGEMEEVLGAGDGYDLP
jgi:transposase